MNYKQCVGEIYTLFSSRPRDYLPFSIAGISTHIKVISDCGSFIVATVLPHKNPKGMGLSTPYNITLDKVEIDNGTYMVVEGKTEIRKKVKDEGGDKDEF